MTFKCIESLEENQEDVFLKVTEILLKLIDNILLYPSDPKYRKVKLGNKLVSTVIIPSVGAMNCLFEIGFQEGVDALLLPPESLSVEKLSLFRTEIANRRNKHLKVETSSANNKSNKMETTPTKQGHSQSLPTSTSKELEIHLQRLPTSVSTQCEVPGPSTSIKQPISQPEPTSSANSTNIFLKKLDKISQIVLQYEQKETKEKVLSVVPILKINGQVQRKMRGLQKQALKSSQNINEASLQETILLEELMKWFKNEFFEWFDKPSCPSCKQGTVVFEGIVPSVQNVEADHVEVHKCVNCSGRVLFPRIFSPLTLMTTRKGRCGEWASAFTCVCHVLGWNARYVLDETDHVWTEVYFNSEDRWVHCDPCECIIDKPLIYEKGWHKNLSYIIAFSCEDVQDVTWRYSANHKAVMARRNKCSEMELVWKINELNRQRQANLTASKKKFLAKRCVMELVQLMQPAMDQEGDDEGRKSGSLSWRLGRLETSVPQTHLPFVWKPTASEVQANLMMITYNTSTDIYTRVNGESIKGWISGVYRAESAFRKEEMDWKTAYICRTEGSLEGRIEWRVDLTEIGQRVDLVAVRCPATTFENGIVTWVLKGDGKEVTFDKGEFVSNHFKGTEILTLTVTMSGGKGTIAWQQAQILRQSLDASEPTFQFSVTFKKSS